MSEPITQDYLYDLAVSPDGSARFSAQASGLYRFDGSTWRNMLASLGTEPFAVTAVALSPDFPADHTVYAGATGIILRSTDGGAGWQVFLLPAPPPIISALAVSPDYAQSGIVYAATLEDGVFVSQDRGVNWDVWNFGLIGFGVNALAVQRNRSVVVGNELGVFQSRNAGRSWTEVALFDAPVTAIAPFGESLLVGVEELGLWQVQDGRPQRIAPDALAGSVERIITDGTNLLILCDQRLYLSRDAGTTWSPLAGELPVTAVASSGRLASDGLLLIGTDSGDIQTLRLAMRQYDG